jgi:hypothetical protein
MILSLTFEFVSHPSESMSLGVVLETTEKRTGEKVKIKLA